MLINVGMLTAIKMNVVMLDVVAPFCILLLQGRR
jgi:hypothetical protein